MQIANAGNSDRRRFSAQALQLAQMLHDWDPIGVYGGDDPNPSPDEYDDLVSPILTALRANPDPTSLARQLREVLSSDYGLSDVVNIDEFAERVVAWSIAKWDESNS
ncbi:MAG: hypothetical protein H7288_25515 [Kineosporiaceae bacterium]|nr:hypothetical protein [Aeromicrobium sp.]